MTPTSGEYPMLVSGIAKWVRDVATRIGAGIEMPAPPPTAKISLPSLRCRKGCVPTDNAVDERDVWLADATHQPVELKLLLEKGQRRLLAGLQVQDQFWRASA